ncbi:MAG: thiamine-phosphate kinase [Parvibaculaceae bacterium]|nr:thiamine-phosphate kinase [Parvibaculaceae bacterium]
MSVDKQSSGHEFDLIATLLAPLTANTPEALGLKDDAAVLQPPEGHDLILTKDAIVEGVHYFPTDPPEQIAQKLMRVNLSDLAAKGANPLGCLLAAGWPAKTSRSWQEAFVRGLGADQESFGLRLMGGDTVSVPGAAFFSLTAFGSVPHGKMVQRTGAQVGDVIFVSGTIGDGFGGLQVGLDQADDLSTEACDALLARYRLPTPRMSLAPLLRRFAHSAIDVSDGLIADLGHLCAASSVGAQVRIADVPFSTGGREGLSRGLWTWADLVSGGDDYEILAVIPPSRAILFQQEALDLGQDVHPIGTIVAAQDGLSILDPEGLYADIPRTGYQHF